MIHRPLSGFLVVLTLAIVAAAQKPRPKPLPRVPPIIFAILHDGKTIEPVAQIEKGKLVQPVSGGDEESKILAFDRAYYKIGTTYRLIFGGANNGTATVKSFDPKMECSANMADITFASPRARLKGNVMALATNAIVTRKGSGVRRLPTPAERTEIEAMVRAELAAKGVSRDPAMNLKYQNLTALDVDNDGKIELVGSFWIDTGKTTRSLLFFIADKDSGGKYAFGYSNYETVDQKDVMSGDIATVDEGVYHELLLDVFDYDDDGTAEVFTYVPGFEGAGFNAYKRAEGKWTKIFEGSNYHCGY